MQARPSAPPPAVTLSGAGPFPGGVAGHSPRGKIAGVDTEPVGQQQGLDEAGQSPSCSSDLWLPRRQTTQGQQTVDHQLLPSQAAQAPTPLKGEPGHDSALDSLYQGRVSVPGAALGEGSLDLGPLGEELELGGVWAPADGHQWPDSLVRRPTPLGPLDGAWGGEFCSRRSAWQVPQNLPVAAPLPLSGVATQPIAALSGSGQPLWTTGGPHWSQD